jgi:replicative DNA helicase
MDERNFGHLGTSFQQGLLKTIIEDKKFAVTIIDVVESKYFDGPYFKYIMENIKELYKLYGCIPNYDTLQQKIMKENKDVSGKVNLDTLITIRDLNLENSGYIKDTSLNFCRQQVLKKSLKQVEEIMQNGEFEQYGKIEEIVQKALQVGASTDEMRDVCHNVREALQKDNRVPFPTGISGIDNLLKGGLARGELGILLMPTGIGKTTMLTKIGNSGFNTGANVLQIFFEDNMNDILRKHYTIWTGISPDDQPKNEEDVVKIVNEVGDRENKLLLLKLPAFGVSISDIKNKIRKLESEGTKLDLLIIDYIDCISLERSIEGEEWKGEGTIMRSLEAMTDEFNIAIWTATQGNRDSIASEVVTTDQMGGSIKKAQIGHVVISAGKTLEQKENNLATVTLLKSRIGKDGIVFQNCKFDNEYLIIDTDTQNTLLGHEEEKAEKKQAHAAEVYKAALESKSKTRQKVEAEINNLLVKKDVIMNEIHNLEHEKEEVVESIVNEGIIPIQAPIPPAGVGINSVVGTVDAESIAMKIIQSSQISQEEKNRQRLGELARERKQKTANMTMNTG